MSALKICTKCKEAKGCDGFYRDSSKSDGLQAWCKECRVAWRIENKKAVAEQRHKYYTANKETWQRWRPHYQATRYGKTAEWRDSQLALQGGGCAICGKPEGGRRSHNIDHDHACCPGKYSCGKCVRGIVCNRCNALLAALDDSDFMKNATRYLDRFKELEVDDYR